MPCKFIYRVYTIHGNRYRVIINNNVEYQVPVLKYTNIVRALRGKVREKGTAADT